MEKEKRKKLRNMESRCTYDERCVVNGSKATTGRQNQIVQVKILRVSEWSQERDRVVGETRVQ